MTFSKEMKMILRPAILSDRATLFDIHVELFREHIEKIWGWDDQWQIANFKKEWDEATTEVIYFDDELLGYMQTRNKPDHLYVLNLALNPKHQNQGHGSWVMNLIKNRATTQGLPVRLGVFKTNQRVIAFYERLGFEVDEKTETGCAMSWSSSTLPESKEGEQVGAGDAE